MINDRESLMKDGLIYILLSWEGRRNDGNFLSRAVSWHCFDKLIIVMSTATSVSFLEGFQHEVIFSTDTLQMHHRPVVTPLARKGEIYRAT